MPAIDDDQPCDGGCDQQRIDVEHQPVVHEVAAHRHHVEGVQAGAERGVQDEASGLSGLREHQARQHQAQAHEHLRAAGEIGLQVAPSDREPLDALDLRMKRIGQELAVVPEASDQQHDEQRGDRREEPNRLYPTRVQVGGVCPPGERVPEHHAGREHDPGRGIQTGRDERHRERCEDGPVAPRARRLQEAPPRHGEAEQPDERGFHPGARKAGVAGREDQGERGEREMEVPPDRPRQGVPQEQGGDGGGAQKIRSDSQDARSREGIDAHAQKTCGEQGPEKVRVAFDTFSRVVDQPVALDEISRIAEGDERVVEQVGLTGPAPPGEGSPGNHPAAEDQPASICSGEKDGRCSPSRLPQAHFSIGKPARASPPCPPSDAGRP